jgi:hypothetical protein
MSLLHRCPLFVGSVRKLASTGARPSMATESTVFTMIFFFIIDDRGDSSRIWPALSIQFVARMVNHLARWFNGMSGTIHAYHYSVIVSDA